MRKLLIATLGLILWATPPLPAFRRASGFDAISSITSNGVASPSTTHTPVGTPTLVVVFIGDVRPATISSVTYGGTSMNAVPSCSFTSGNTNVGTWALPNPSSGAQTIQINGSSSSFNPTAFIISFTGTETDTTAYANCVTDTGGPATDADQLSVTSATNNLVIDFIYVTLANPGDLNMTEGGSQSERGELLGATTEQNAATSEKAGAATVTMDYGWGTTTDVNNWTYFGLDIVRAGGGGGGGGPVSKPFAGPVKGGGRVW